MRIVLTTLVAVVLAGAEAVLHATATNAVPEITPGTMSAGLAALAAGVLVVRARWRSK